MSWRSRSDWAWALVLGMLLAVAVAGARPSIGAASAFAVRMAAARASAATMAPARASAATHTCADASSLTGRPRSATRPGTLEVLVPTSANELIVCRFRGPNLAVKKTEGGLLASGGTSSLPEIDKITSALDALKPGRRIACPMYVLAGSETATFYYRSGPSVTLTVQLGGCAELSNGHLTRLGLDSPALTDLDSLLHSG